jgi:hypothetical protein
MELLAQLKNEDDNPRGQQQGRFVSGATLEEAAAAETRRAEIKAAKLPLPRQEAGIIHLMQARNFFARLKLPEPTWDADGAPVWDCSDETMARAYAEAMKCCHPEWSHHPKRDTGFALLTEAHDVLTNRTGKRDAYLREFVAAARERAARLAAVAPSAAADHERDYLGRATVSNSWSTAAARKPGAADEGAADVAAELEAQAAAKRRRLRELEQAAAAKRERAAAAAAGPSRPPAAGPAPGPARPPPGPSRPPPGPPRPPMPAADDDDDDDAAAAAAAAARARREQNSKKKRRAGVF